jgi:spore maturation protein A
VAFLLGKFHRFVHEVMGMVMSWIFTGMVAVAVVFAVLSGRGSELAAAIPEGAQAGITLCISLAGSICLWTGLGKLMEKAGFTGFLSRLLRPLLRRIFPSANKDKQLAGALSANICANFLGLGNAATPMGIQAAQRLAAKRADGVAGDELCRLIVLNTASIQLIPSTVAAVRSSLGCHSPFDILPAVWITSICSAGLGLCAAWVLGRMQHK